jgi:hypothetical protein
MLKWILGCLGLAIVVVACALWYGYRKLQTFADLPPVSTVTIMAPPSRVFASLASADSMTTWMIEGTKVTSPHHGLLVPADTVMMMGTLTDTLRHRAMWIVTGVTSDKLFTIEMRSESTGEVAIARRDSLIAVGDSTQIVSSFTSPMFDDSVRAAQKKGGAAGAMMGMARKVMMSAQRLDTDAELKRLKARIEGRVVGDSVPPVPQQQRAPASKRPSPPAPPT